MTRTETPDGIDYLERARDIAPALAAAADEIERRRELPEPIVAALVERGFFRLLLPRSLGGAELLPAQYVPIIEELAKIDASTAWCLNQNSGCSMTAAYLAPEVAREIFGGPRGILAWGPGPGEARIVEPAAIASPRHWSFASGSHHASWLGCHVPVIEADGSRAGTPTAARWCARCCSRKARPSSPTSGTRSGCAAPAATSIRSRICSCRRRIRSSPSRRERRRAREPGLLYRFSSLQLYAAGFAGVALGIARGTLDAFIELARDKIPRGASAHAAQQQRDPAQVGAGRGAARSAARAYLLGSLEDITEAVARARPHHARRADDDPPRLDLCDPHRARGRRHPLSGGRRDRDLRRQPVRAPLPRHPHGVAAIAGPAGAFRDRRPVPDRARTRQPDVALSAGSAAGFTSGDPVLLEPGQHSGPAVLGGLGAVARPVVGVEAVRRVGIDLDLAGLAGCLAGCLPSSRRSRPGCPGRRRRRGRAPGI